VGILTLLYLFIVSTREEGHKWWEIWKVENPEVWKGLIFLLVGVSKLVWWANLLLLIGVAFLFRRKPLPVKFLKIGGGIAFLFFAITTNFVAYIIHRTLFFISSTQSKGGLHFLNVNKTIRETTAIPFYLVADRIIGSLLGLIFAVVGYLWLVWKRREFVIALPLWGVGLFAAIGGLRFTIYAVPIAALSATFLTLELAGRWSKSRVGRWAITSLLFLFLIAPNITHIIGCCSADRKLVAKMRKIYPLPTPPYVMYPLFTNREIATLVELGKMGSPKDYVISWWDYGYFILYYSNKNTLIDGGKHTEDNFLVSAILMSHNPYLVANLSRLAVEAYAAHPGVSTKAVNYLLYKNGKPINVAQFLEKVGSPDFTPPKPTRNIYLFFPLRMVNILYAVSEFSDRDLNSGESFARHHIYGVGRIVEVGPRQLVVGRVLIDLRRGVVVSLVDRREVPIKRLIVRLGNQTNITQVNPVGINVMLISSLRLGAIMDDYFYNSAAIQMGVLGNYDPNLFKLVVDTPLIKIYQLKR
jgi:dolichyl-diphosphooligosaccharide--protein glycosyltransferase/undecaprenyl-diphosphooligosaccharide--protein glycosyltransferase